MSRKTGERRRRVDAERSRSAVLDAAMQVLAERPHAGLSEVATAAGVSRQTVYAHYPSRAALIEAVVERLTADTVVAFDGARLTEGTPMEALGRLLDACWALIARQPLLLSGSLASPDAEVDRARHSPLRDRIHALVSRGQRAGAFDRAADAAWLTTAILALGHAAWGEAGSGRMTVDEAAHSWRSSVFRVVAGTGPEGRTRA